MEEQVLRPVQDGGSPGEDRLGELIPTTIVQPGPFPPLKSGLEMHLTTAFAL